ncbi:putative ankyrin repeat protein RF_0381 [Cloeon dipterum]|uniref:putative ankyrin repeat protein RF_0381 n=1 Tax=Cloeon dipterum TaxID=197152 RepID=UPI00321FED64
MPAKKVNVIEFLAKTTFNFHDDIKNWIMKSEVIVFIDGFDEVCPDFREKIINILIAINNAGVPLFVGTRPYEVHHIQERIKNTTIVEIEPLDEAKQIEFLQTVARKNERDINQLRENFKDKDILGNPLYLNLLAEYNGDGNLYEIFDTIVRRKVEICLKRENGGNDVGDETIKKSLKFLQLVASRFVTGVKIEEGSVTKEELEKINAFGVVTYFNEQVNFTHQTFAEFLTAQKFLYDLKNPGPESVPLFNEELAQCRKFVDLFFSTEKGKDVTYAEDFVECAKLSDPVKLLKQICRENLSQMFRLLNPDLSLKDEDGKNALHFALRHLEMVKKVHEKNSNLAIETTKNGENCLHLAIGDNKCSEEVAIWLLKNTEADKNAETEFKETPLLLAGLTQKWEVARQLLLYNIEINQIGFYGKSIFHYAVCSNDIVLVQELLDRGDIVNFKDSNGNTALHLAAMLNENPNIVNLLLEKGAKVNIKNNGKRTALHYAAVNNEGTEEVFQQLIVYDADVNSQDEVGNTALHLTSGWNGNPEKVKILLEKGAKVNAQNNEKWTALHFATRHNPASEIVQTLLENGADINLQTQYGSTALHLAAGWNKNPELVKILLENGAKVNAQDNDKWTALHLAARYNPASEIVQMLLENGADINSQTQYGSTAFHLAAVWNKNPEIVKILLENGAKVNAQNNDKWTALHFATRDNPASEIVQILLENGADIHSQNKYGSTALHLAAGWNKNPELVKMLLEKGAKVNAQDNDKWTALHLAARYNPASEIVQMLLENGADINSQTQYGTTAFHLAAVWNKNPEIVKILLENGAKVNAQNNDKWTALHIAARYNPASEIVQILLENGADIHSQNKYGSTALHLAAGWNENPELVQILLEKGAKVNAQNNDKWTALHYAATHNRRPEVVQKLLDKGAEINVENARGETPIFLAAKHNPAKEVVQILLEVNKRTRNDKQCTVV